MSEADGRVLRAADWRLGLRWAEAAVMGYQLTVGVEEDRLVVAIGSPLKRDYISCAGMVAIFWVCASSDRGRERLRTRRVRSAPPMRLCHLLRQLFSGLAS